MTKGLVHIYTGDGKGKTTASLGLSIRALGDNKKVLFVQFFKNGSSSEINILKQLDNIEILVEPTKYGRFKNIKPELQEEAKKKYHDLFVNAINLSNNYDLVVFDEIISTINHGIICVEEVIDFIKNKKETLEVVLTGRNPSDKLIEIADYVSNVEKIKHPFDKGVAARRGIEF